MLCNEQKYNKYDFRSEYHIIHLISMQAYAKFIQPSYWMRLLLYFSLSSLEKKATTKKYIIEDIVHLSKQMSNKISFF